MTVNIKSYHHEKTWKIEIEKMQSDALQIAMGNGISLFPLMLSAHEATPGCTQTWSSQYQVDADKKMQQRAMRFRRIWSTYHLQDVGSWTDVA